MTLLLYFVFFIKILEINNTIISVPLSKEKPILFQELDRYSISGILHNSYYFNISIGNPRQTFKIKLDMNSMDLWVLSHKLRGLDEDFVDVAKLHSLYNENKLNTSLQTGKKWRLPDSSMGSLCIDNISIGRFQINRQVFLGVNEITRDKLIKMAGDGVLGLALSSSTFQNYSSLFYNMINQRIISRPIISVYLNRDLKSQILFGGLRLLLGNWLYIPVKGNKWEIPIDVIQINNKKNYKFCDEDDCRAIVDAGSYFIRGPNLEISEINDYIGAVPLLMEDIFAISCNFLSFIPSISFILGGFNFTLTPYDYTREIQYYGQSICISIFQSNKVKLEEYDDYDDDTLDKNWILGATFMEAYHTAFDFGNKRIGFTKAR